MSSSLIDVLLPVYNGAATVESAVASMQAQTHDALCIHVVDDGSTDDTPAILARLAAADPRIRVHSKPNGGIVDALNHGLGFCTAEWIARHDADDLALPHRLQTQLAYLQAHPECVAVGSAVRHIDTHGQPTGSYGRMGSPDEADALWYPVREPYLIHPFLLVRRDALVAMKGYRHVHHAEDADLYWRLRDVGRLHNLPDVLGDYRLHEGSISGSSLHNGRMMAVSSQLAGLSARRRAAGEPDIPFDKPRIAQLHGSASLRAMVDAAAADLKPEELPAFELAVAAKLLELTAYRPYELAESDCVFIRGALDAGFDRITDPVNRRLIRAQASGAAARLAHAGNRRSALALLPTRLYAPFLLRYLSRLLLPGDFRQRLRLFISRGQAVK